MNLTKQSCNNAKLLLESSASGSLVGQLVAMWPCFLKQKLITQERTFFEGRYVTKKWPPRSHSQRGRRASNPLSLQENHCIWIWGTTPIAGFVIRSRLQHFYLYSSSRRVNCKCPAKSLKGNLYKYKSACFIGKTSQFGKIHNLSTNLIHDNYHRMENPLSISQERHAARAVHKRPGEGGVMR